MAHNHGYEYRIRVIREDGIEELSVWMNNTDHVAQAMMAVQKPQGKTFWLLVRTIICPNCSDREQVLEYPIMNIPSQRCISHDSRHLQAVDLRNRSSLGFR
jgi:hypothetical protein